MILLESGTMYGFGYAALGQLGYGGIKNQTAPCLVKPFVQLHNFYSEDYEEKVIQISLGQNHSIALTNKGNVFTSGSSQFGQLGHSDFETLATFTQVKPSFSLNESHQSRKKYGGLESHIVAVFAGGNHSWAIKDVDEFERRAEQWRS
jgi:aromatic ring-opening dioxygenase catalytic subunit (LigB family)